MSDVVKKCEVSDWSSDERETEAVGLPRWNYSPKYQDASILKGYLPGSSLARPASGFKMKRELISDKELILIPSGSWDTSIIQVCEKLKFTKAVTSTSVCYLTAKPDISGGIVSFGSGSSIFQLNSWDIFHVPYDPDSDESDILLGMLYFSELDDQKKVVESTPRLFKTSWLWRN